ncbi:MAG: urease accessory protein UreD, partial [Novipirellula sp. JB048]
RIGRKQMAGDERFRFKSHHAITEIYQAGDLIFKDNLYLAPEEIDLDQFGQYEGYTHQGSLFFLDPHADVDATMSDVTARLSAESGVAFGISKLRDQAYLLRVLGHEGEQLFKLFTEIRLREDARINRKG